MTRRFKELIITVYLVCDNWQNMDPPFHYRVEDAVSWSRPPEASKNPTISKIMASVFLRAQNITTLKKENLLIVRITFSGILKTPIKLTLLTLQNLNASHNCNERFLNVFLWKKCVRFLQYNLLRFFSVSIRQ